VAAWFSEDSGTPDDLSITLELRDFESQTRMLQAVYVVEWSYNNNHYGVVVHTDPQGIGDFLVGKSEDGDSIFDRWDICYGTHDEDSNTITWTVSKETVGNPPPLSRLTNIQSHTHLREWIYSKIYPGTLRVSRITLWNTKGVFPSFFSLFPY